MYVLLQKLLFGTKIWHASVLLQLGDFQKGNASALLHNWNYNNSVHNIIKSMY